MGIFSDPNEQRRREGLKQLEDKRVKLAEELNRRGFKPEGMLFAQTENGGFVATCHFDSKQWVVVSPGFLTDEEYIVDSSDHFPVRKQEVLVKSEGMGGIMGFGKKGEHGVEYIITLNDGREVKMPFVFGRSSWGEYDLKKNPLLPLKRRRKDANIVWEFAPIDNAKLQRILEIADGYLL